MIVAFYFRVGPTGGPHELVSVPPRRYPITGAARVEAERGNGVPGDLEPCAIGHACNLAGPGRLRRLRTTRVTTGSSRLAACSGSPSRSRSGGRCAIFRGWIATTGRVPARSSLSASAASSCARPATLATATLRTGPASCSTGSMAVKRVRCAATRTPRRRPDPGSLAARARAQRPSAPVVSVSCPGPGAWRCSGGCGRLRSGWAWSIPERRAGTGAERPAAQLCPVEGPLQSRSVGGGHAHLTCTASRPGGQPPARRAAWWRRSMTSATSSTCPARTAA